MRSLSTKNTKHSHPAARTDSFQLGMDSTKSDSRFTGAIRRVFPLSLLVQMAISSRLDPPFWTKSTSKATATFQSRNFSCARCSTQKSSRKRWQLSTIILSFIHCPILKIYHHDINSLIFICLEEEFLLMIF